MTAGGMITLLRKYVQHSRLFPLEKGNMRFIRSSSFVGNYRQHFIKICVTLVLLNLTGFLLLNQRIGVHVLDSSKQTQEFRIPRNVRGVDFAIRSRSLTLLATQRMNQVMQELMERLRVNPSCSKWWANPLEVRENIIMESTTEHDYHLLIFDAHSNWEKVTFQTIAKVNVQKRPFEVQFMRDEFLRQPGRKLPKSISLSEDSTIYSDETMLTELCSRDQGSTTDGVDPKSLSPLPEWPVNTSFMASDYLRFDSPDALFNIVPSRPVCAPAKLLIIVSSAPSHFRRRQIIRDIVNQQGMEVRVYFLLGRVENALHQRVTHEANLLKDIIQANVVDTYQNLTLKLLSILSYVYFSCSTPEHEYAMKFDRPSYNPPQHILKCDDDFFLNVEAALKVATANPEAEIMGYRYCQANPIRESGAKWLVPEYIYTGSAFPPYLIGGTILIRSDVIPNFLQACLVVPMINAEDVYLGLLSKVIGVHPRHSSYFETHNPPEKSLPILRYHQLKYTINFHIWTDEDLLRTWKLWIEMEEVFQSKASLLTLLTSKYIRTPDLKLNDMNDSVRQICEFRREA